MGILFTVRQCYLSAKLSLSFTSTGFLGHLLGLRICLLYSAPPSRKKGRRKRAQKQNISKAPLNGLVLKNEQNALLSLANFFQ
jgi:hypothetical protein